MIVTILRIPLRFAAVLAPLALAACGGPINPALEDARAAVRAAQNDPEIQSRAPLALDQAQTALARAEAAREVGAGREEVSHLAYLTNQNVEIAELRAAENRANERIQALGERRGEVQLEQAEARAAQLEQELAELQAERTERGYVMTLEDILFDVDEASLTTGGQQEVARLAEFLRQFPEQNVVIEGHTDSTGDAGYNQQLSERRAMAVEDALVRLGIDPMRVMATGYGEQFPEVSNETAAGRQQNRRVEIVILDEDQQVVPRS